MTSEPMRFRSRKSNTEPGAMYWKLIAKRPPASATMAAEIAWAESFARVEWIPSASAASMS